MNLNYNTETALVLENDSESQKYLNKTITKYEFRTVSSTIFNNLSVNCNKQTEKGRIWSTLSGDILFHA